MAQPGIRGLGLRPGGHRRRRRREGPGRRPQELLQRHLERAMRAVDDGQQRIGRGLPPRGGDVTLIVDGARSPLEDDLEATKLVPTHLFRPGYRVRRAKGAPTRAWAYPRKDRGVGDADIAFRATTPAHTITHELGHTLEYQNRPLFEEAAAFIGAHTKGPKKKLNDGAKPGYNYNKDEYYRPGLSEKREDWRYATSIRDGVASDPSIGPYKVRSTELISSGLEWLEHAPETLFVEVLAFADFLLRRVVLRPKD